MILTDTILEKEQIVKKNSFALLIIIKEKPKKILDLTTTEWLIKELNQHAVYVIDSKKELDVKDKILPYIKNYDYFMIIYNNTPYITDMVVNRIIDYVSFKNSRACKLFSGAVYKTSYYINENNLIYDNFYMQDQDAFLSVETDQDYVFAEKYFTKRIIQTLIKNGVVIENPSSVIISARCEIGKGTIILNNCIIKGKTIIGNNVVINNNTSIIDSHIGDGASISNSIVSKSKIGNNVIISPYCNINKSHIDKDSYIGYYCVIDNYKLKKGSNIPERTTLTKEKGDIK